MPKVSLHLYLTDPVAVLRETEKGQTGASPVTLMDPRCSQPLMTRRVQPKLPLLRETLTLKKADQFSVSSGESYGRDKPEKLYDNKINARQRRMSSKLAEWLDEYNAVSQKQQAYLAKIQDLRKGLQHRDEQNVMMTIDHVRNSERQRQRQRRVPVMTLSRMTDSPVTHGPEPFPNRPCVFHDHTTHVHSNNAFRMAPNSTPRKLAPIVKRVTAKRQTDDSPSQNASPRPDIEKMRTEYETFESIAKRNKLSLTHFFNSSLSHRAMRPNKRLPMSISTVTVMDAVPDDEVVTSSMEYITDISSKKTMSSNKGNQEYKPG